MDSLATPHESKKFVIILSAVSLAWLIIGITVQFSSREQMSAFIQIFLFSFLNLIFLTLLFWNLFFTAPHLKTQSINKIRIMTLGFFKLVFLAFLAITLKRLSNASSTTQLMGLSIIWIGPLISGVILKMVSNSKKN